MSHALFENIISNMFVDMGYTTQITKTSWNKGINIIAKKNSIEIGIQAKCYSSVVSNSAILEVIAEINHYECNKEIFITNNYFTKSAVELATCYGIILWDRDMLKQKI